MDELAARRSPRISEVGTMDARICDAATWLMDAAEDTTGAFAVSARDPEFPAEFASDLIWFAICYFHMAGPMERAHVRQHYPSTK